MLTTLALLGAVGWLAAACLARHTASLAHLLAVLHEEEAPPADPAWEGRYQGWVVVAAMYAGLAVMMAMLAVLATLGYR